MKLIPREEFKAPSGAYAVNENNVQVLINHGINPEGVSGYRLYPDRIVWWSLYISPVTKREYYKESTRAR